MDKGPGWLPDPERAGDERYWNGSGWTDRVRPAAKSRSMHLPEHAPELQRALAAATADIDAVEDRLATLFQRTEGTKGPVSRPRAPITPDRRPAHDDLDDPIDLDDDAKAPDEMSEDAESVVGSVDQADSDDDGSFTELDAALAAEGPEEPVKPKRGFLRRRS